MRARGSERHLQHDHYRLAMQLPNQRHVPKRCVGAVHCHDRRDRHVRGEQWLERLGVRRRDDRRASLVVDPGVVSPSRADQPQRLTRWLRYIPLVVVSTTITRRWRQPRVGQLAIILGTEAEALPSAQLQLNGKVSWRLSPCQPLTGWKVE